MKKHAVILALVREPEKFELNIEKATPVVTLNSDDALSVFQELVSKKDNQIYMIWKVRCFFQFRKYKNQAKGLVW